jgi:hypothetical protein
MDDFVVGCRVVEAGYRMLFDPAAEAFEPTTAALGHEMRRKRRIFVANFCAVPLLCGLLRPDRAGFFYVSRKLLRWLTPLWLAGLLAASMSLRHTALGAAALAVQAGFYGGALLYALGLRAGRPWRPLLPLYDFVRLQMELARGLAVAALGHPAPAWERSERGP